MQQEMKKLHTPQGDICYWCSCHAADAPWLVFLPGLTADHRLFAPQLAHFAAKYNCLVWDAPGHALSRPFELSFGLAEMAEYLHRILQTEGIMQPLLIGQSLGGYLAQQYLCLYPQQVCGIISIDSGPLARRYYRRWELACLKHTRGMYAAIPWSWLRFFAARGNAETAAGRQQMLQMMDAYDRRSFAALAGFGFRLLAEGIEATTEVPPCPTLLICGRQDKVGFVLRFNRCWSQQQQLPLQWIDGAGHNANVDAPLVVNAAIESFVINLMADLPSQ